MPTSASLLQVSLHKHVYIRPVYICISNHGFLDILARLRMRWPRNQGSIPNKCREFVSHPQIPDSLGDRPRFASTG